MSEQELRDRNNRYLGKIKTRPDGKIEIRDASWFFKGIFDPRTNDTRDANDKFVGKGNLLTTLL